MSFFISFIKWIEIFKLLKKIANQFNLKFYNTFCLGFVAFIVGNTQVSIYSPDGQCQYTLSPLLPSPVGIAYLTLALFGDQVIACGGNGNTNCYSYDAGADQWSIFSTGKVIHSERLGLTHQGKIYLTDDSQPEVFDPSSKTWSTWRASPSTPYCSCSVSWNDVILQFGGYYSLQQIYRYSPSINTWTALNPQKAPLDLCFSGCVVMPDQNILIAGSSSPAVNYKKFAVYNVTSNTWPQFAFADVNVFFSTPLVIGSRIFTIPFLSYSTVVEYGFNDNSVTAMDAQLSLARPYFAGAIAVPATWFSHLPGDCSGIL